MSICWFDINPIYCIFMTNNNNSNNNSSSNLEKIITEQEVKAMIKDGKIIIILFGAVYDLSTYIENHPGGK